MEYIDEKFKDERPEITVDKIKATLQDLGIQMSELWNDTKIENCNSLRITMQGGFPGSNGKGVTKEFAAASAYGEFMERLQSGLCFYKHQSFENDDAVYLHSFAPDKKYVTKAELLEDSEWMEPICKAYSVTKETIANACCIFNCSDKIITLPYYSLFDDKYVYLPAMFVEYVYTSNGSCFGNTKEEAWVHALSEIFERHSNLEIISKGEAVPIIPREKLKNFKVVNKIIDAIEARGIYDVEVLDFSLGKKFPVIGVRIINKETQCYSINVGADPVFEIAVERTFTEIFQGRNLDTFTTAQPGIILNSVNDVKATDNKSNQVETANGLFTAKFFSDNAGEDDSDSFENNSGKTNKELLGFMLKKFKDMGLSVYVRNNSFLGFPCYKFVVPGFSDIRIDYIKSPVMEYYFGDRASKTLRNIKKASKAELSELLMFRNMIAGWISRRGNYSFLSGLPFVYENSFLLTIHLAYAAYKTNNKSMFNAYLEDSILFSKDKPERKKYLLAIKQWFKFVDGNVDENTAVTVIEKFYDKNTANKLMRNLKSDKLFDEFLVDCDMNCARCKYNNNCNYQNIKSIIANVGKEYQKFTDGQARENFAF